MVKVDCLEQWLDKNGH